MRYMGGYPVSRNSKSNTVDQISKIYSTNTEFRLALSPEGTRKSKKMEIRFLFYCKKSQSSNNMCITKLYR